ncbi:hypothetical protein D3C87_2087750 [compost metagenome]
MVRLSPTLRGTLEPWWVLLLTCQTSPAVGETVVTTKFWCGRPLVSSGLIALTVTLTVTKAL